MNIIREMIAHAIYTPVILIAYVALYSNFRSIEVSDISIGEMSVIFATAFVTPFLLRPLRYSRNRKKLGSIINNSPSYIFVVSAYVVSAIFRCVIVIVSKVLVSLRWLSRFTRKNNITDVKNQKSIPIVNKKDRDEELESGHHNRFAPQKDHLPDTSISSYQPSTSSHEIYEYSSKLFIEKLNLMIQVSREAMKVYEGRMQLVGICNLLLTSSILDKTNIISYLVGTQIMGEPNVSAIKLEGKRRNIITWGCLLYSPDYIFSSHDDNPGWIYAYTFLAAGGTILGQGKKIDVLNVPEKIFIKVGMTTQENPIKRVDQQLGTSNPMPALLLFLGSVHACDKAEKALHLRLKDNHLEEGATGREWFLVESKEMKSLLLDFCFNWNNQFK